MSDDKYRHIQRLSKCLTEIDYQPEWRGEAARCHQYYAGKQLEPDVIAKLKERGIPVLTTNMVQPTINGVLGMEARSRTDWFVRADDDEHTEIAEAINVRVNEGLRTANANQGCAEAYSHQVIGGLGWVEVKTNPDPLSSKYRISQIHRNEIDLDWRSASDLRNCRWLLRHRWVDVEEAEAAFPKHKDIIRHSRGGWSSFDTAAWDQKGDVLSNAYDEYQYSTRPVSDWLNDIRDMVKVYELYYRVFENGLVLRDSQGRAVLFDERNDMHLALVASGRVRVEKRVVPKLRLSWYIGPHHVIDMPSPHPHNYYPYVPFFGMREDETNIPYGLVRAMLSPQDEINFRRIKLTAQLNFKRIVMDDDATDMTDDELREQVHRQEGIVKLNGAGRREGGPNFKIETDAGIAAQQFSVMQNAVEQIQDVVGVYNAFLGKESGAQSGVAINSLVEQGSTTLADINDNYRWARKMVGELVLAHEVEEMKSQQDIVVMVPQQYGQKAKEVVLNKTGEGREISNAVAHAKTQVVLGEIQQSQGYRAQVTQMLLDLIGKLPDEIQVQAMGMVLDQIDLPADKKDKLQSIINKATGQIDPDDLDDKERAALQRQQQKQQAMEELGLKEIMLKLQELEINIQKTGADTEYTQARAGTEQMKQREMAAQMKREQAMPPPMPPRFRQQTQQVMQ